MGNVNVLYVQYMSVNKIPSTIFQKITVGQLFRKVKMSILLDYRCLPPSTYSSIHYCYSLL